MKNFFIKLKKVDIFALGPSSFLYYGLIFYLTPLVTLFGLGFLSSLSFYEEVNVRVLAYSLLGLVFLVAGYYSGIGSFIARKVPNVVKREWKKERVVWVFGATFLLGLIFKAVRILGGGYFHTDFSSGFVNSAFSSAVGLFTWFGAIALVIAFAWYYHLRKQESGSSKQVLVWQIIAYSTLAVELAYALPTCSKLVAAIPVLLVLITRWYLWEKSYKSILVVGLIVLALFPYASICKTATTFEEFQASFGSGNKAVDTLNFSADSILSRFGQLKIFTNIVEANLPRLYGKDYYKFFVSLGPPRFIWKAKPAIEPDGNAFGHQINVLDPEDRTTSIGPTAIGDFYINFGLAGIIGGMFLLGAVFRFIYIYLIHSHEPIRQGQFAYPLSGIMIYSIAWVQILKHLENWQYPFWAGMVKLFIILFIIHLVLTHKNPVQYNDIVSR